MNEHPVNNTVRKWFIVFTLWCKERGLDVKNEDFNDIKKIPEDKYQELLGQANYICIKNKQCPECFKKIGVVTDNKVKCEHCLALHEVGWSELGRATATLLNEDEVTYEDD